MKTETKVLLGFLLATITIIVGAVMLLSRNQPSVQRTDQGVIYEIDYSKGQKIGSDSAKLRLVEFSDLQCPACAAAQPVVKEVLASNKDNIQLIYRHFPLPQHLNAKKAINAAEAAGEQGKFQEMHNKLFETQNNWSQLPDPTAYFLGLAKEFGLDEQKIKEAIEKNSFEEKIKEDQQEGNKLQVNSTPTFFLNGKKLSLSSLADLKSEVEKELLK